MVVAALVVVTLLLVVDDPVSDVELLEALLRYACADLDDLTAARSEDRTVGEPWD